MLEQAAYDVPKHLVAAGVLVWDSAGRILMAYTHNRSGPILPGGLVEVGESPAQAAARECQEEVGLDIEPTRLLCVQHLPPQGDRPGSMQFVFDSAPLPGNPMLRLQASEISRVAWMSPNEAVSAHGERGRSRLQAALTARETGLTAYLD